MTESLRALAHVKRVLVLHDLHPECDNAAWRAALLARAQGGWLRILHVSRFRSPEAARERLAALAWRLQEHLQLAVVAQAFRGFQARELRRAAEDADLVVLRALSGLDAATGLHPLTAARIGMRPTLVVRTPANVAYRRILVGANDVPDAQLLAAAGRTMTDGAEVPAVAPLHSAASLLERERSLYPDVVAIAGSHTPSLARRFLALTRTDTLLLPHLREAAMAHRDNLPGSGMLVSSVDFRLGEERP
jgi:hypothetical protein